MHTHTHAHTHTHTHTHTLTRCDQGYEERLASSTHWTLSPVGIDAAAWNASVELTLYATRFKWVVSLCMCFSVCANMSQRTGPCVCVCTTTSRRTTTVITHRHGTKA